MARFFIPALVFFSLTFQAHSQTSLCFSGAEVGRYPVDTVPAGVTTGDFNNDGKVDIAVATTNTNKVGVLMNSGNGTFLPAATYPVGLSPEDVVAADFNGDSIDDLAVTNYGANSVSVLLNNGSGTFLTAVNYAVGNGPKDIVTADFNNDGFLDIACANYSGGSINILFNNGLGVFTIQPAFATSGTPLALTVGKFNLDTIYDIAYTNTSAAMRVGFGNGSGGFPTGNTYLFSTSINGLTTGDFNNDGKTDIAGNSAGNQVFVRYNNGTGFFSVGTSITLINAGFGIASADFNNDGYDDIIANNYMNTEADLIYSTGTGFYKLTGIGTAGTSNGGAYGVATADFDQDGFPDFVVTNHVSRNILTVRNTTSGKFSIAESYSLGETPQGLAVADIDGDGIKDILSGNGAGTIMHLHFGTGGGNYSAPVIYNATGNNIYWISAADFNGDGKTDCVTANYSSGSISLFFNDGSGGFLAPVNLSVGSYPSCMAAIDFDHDGDIDLALPAGGAFKLLTNNGNGVFSISSMNIGSGTVYSIDTADFNGDGNCDLLIGRSSTVAILYSSGSGTFSAISGPPSSLQPRYATAGHFNNDSYMDFAVSNYNGSSVSVYYSLGNGYFTAPNITNVGPNPVAIHAYDVNGDHFDDLVVANYTDPSITILQTQPMMWGTFYPHKYATGSFPNNICWEDLTNDNSPDILVANASGNSLTLLVNNTASVIATGPTTVCNNGTVMLIATPGSGNYVWTPGGSTNDTLLVTASGNYYYTFTSSNGGCSSTSPSVAITVNSSQYPVATLSSSNDTVCLNQSPITLSGLPSGGLYYGIGVSGNLFAPSNAGTGTHIINYLYTDSVGCSDTASIPIFVKTIPSVIATATSPSICIGMSDTLTASGGNTYSWSFGGNNSIEPVLPNVTTIYSVTGTGNNGCTDTATITVVVNNLPVVNISAASGYVCFGQNDTLTATGALIYSWNFGGTNPSEIVSPAVNTVYLVTGTDINGCSDTASYTLLVSPVPSVSVSGNPDICLNSTAILTASGAMYYSWSSGGNNASETVTPLANTTYFVTGTDTNGCSDTASILVIVHSLPTINVNANPTASVCQGSALTLTGSGASSYSWSGGIQDGISFTPATSSSYTVTGTDANGCSDTASISINLYPLPTINVNANPTASVCQGSAITLTGGGASSYSWSGGIQDGISFTPATSSSYTVTGTDANGCADTASISITVNPLPNVSIDLSPIDTQCVATTSVQLSSGLPAGGIYSGTAVSGNNFDPSVAGPGTYMINYFYTDNNGCSASAVDSIYVDVCTDVTTNTKEQMDIFPNPASDHLNIKISGTTAVLKIELTDQLGRNILRNDFPFVQSDTNLSIDTSNTADGIYILSITFSSGTISQKVYINH